MSRAVRVILILIILAAEVYPGFAGKGEWVEVRSKHFTVITDDGERNGRTTLMKFEQMRAGFASVFQKATVNIPVPLEIVAFHNSKEIKQYAPLYNGKPIELAGYFQQGEDQNFIALDLSAPNGWSTVFHEYGHLLLNGNLRNMPVWVNEGFADFFSGMEISGKYMSLGTFPQGYAQILLNSRWMKTAELISVEHTSRDYNEGDRRNVFYAQSWLTVHYILLKHKEKQLDAYVSLTEDQHMPPPEAFAKAFGMTTDQFDKELERYLHGPMQYLRAPAPEEDAGTFEFHTLSKSDAEARLADFKFHLMDHKAEGIADFERILSEDPNNTLANREMGYSFLQKGEFEKAAPYLKRASETGSTDPRVHFFNAMLLSRSASGTMSMDREHIEEIQAELKKAIELDPSYSEAFNLLALTESQRGDLDAAIQSQAKAVGLSPRNEFFLMNLSTYEMQAEKWEQARKTLTTLANSGNPMIATEAQQGLLRLQEMENWKKEHWKKEHPNDRVVVEQQPTVVSASAEDVNEPVQQLPNQPIAFLKGKVVSVDCNTEPQAVLEVSSGNKTWHLRVANRAKVLLIGADQFSCDWKGRAVSINYRPQAAGNGDVVSLELQ
jgi:tetratricopeptide (TPR) repeat protein